LAAALLVALIRFDPPAPDTGTDAGDAPELEPVAV
jgi:hypothetical protein